MRISADFCKLLCFDVRMTHSVFGSTTHENGSHYFGVTMENAAYTSLRYF